MVKIGALFFCKGGGAACRLADFGAVGHDAVGCLSFMGGGNTPACHQKIFHSAGVEGAGEPVAVKDLAQLFGYHEKYLGKLFKEKTGKSIREYCNEARLSKAEALLRNSTLSVIELSSRAGFDNVSYFNRLFRKKHGLTPVEYRKRNRT